MQTSLIDPEGFPRNDIDVAGIRTARTQILRLGNDLKDVLGEMGGLLERGLPRDTETLEGEREGEREEGEREEEQGSGGMAFARVDSVARDSPAQLAVRRFLLSLS